MGLRHCNALKKRPYSSMTSDSELLDPAFCLRKADEYRAKARDTNHDRLKSAFEAAAGEYDMRAKANAERAAKLGTA
jgi:hypothetical protein